MKTCKALGALSLGLAAVLETRPRLALPGHSGQLWPAVLEAVTTSTTVKQAALLRFESHQAGCPFLQTAFKLADRDGDDKLSRIEYYEFQNPEESLNENLKHHVLRQDVYLRCEFPYRLSRVRNRPALLRAATHSGVGCSESLLYLY